MSGDRRAFGEGELGGTESSLEACTIRQGERAPDRYRVVGPDGEYDPDAVPDLTTDELRDLYGWMVVQQVVDERMVKLQRRGEMGTYASGRGQEASIVGCAAPLSGEDWLFPYGREAAAMLHHGMSMRDLLLYWRGVEDANRFPDANVFPIAIAIGTHVPIGVGHAWGMLRDDADAVTAMMMGDGHPSTGEVQAGMNMAGVLGVPAVFYCQNNGYSISQPFANQTAANSVAQKALAWGLDGVRVDGNDVLAVYDAVRTARERALDGTPVLVEGVTYRLDAHTTNDDPGRYRPAAEAERWEAREPLSRFEAFLKAEGHWAEIDAEARREAAHERFDEAKAAADAYETGGVEELFEYVYDDLPPDLRRQAEEFAAFLAERPDAYDHIEERPKG
ncbi:MAG: thiamine pyrophosphate-dependent enzyme [Haloferacaceae archaeon]